MQKAAKGPPIPPNLMRFALTEQCSYNRARYGKDGFALKVGVSSPDCIELGAVNLKIHDMAHSTCIP